MTLNNRAQSMLQDMLANYQDKWGGFDAFDPGAQEAITQLYQLTR
jgi:hypothetical protein